MQWDSEIATAFTLEGKVAVITGAGSGLGQEAARLFAVAGARVVLADVDRAGLEATAAKVLNAGGDALVVPTDVGKRDGIDALAAAAVRRWGRLDNWINSAGITVWADITEASTEAAERVVAVNMMGTYWGCVVAANVMKECGGGTIINLSSTAGDRPVSKLSIYGMTKAAVNQLTRVAAKEFGSFGVRVNAVVPGWIDTPINSSMYTDSSGGIDPNLRDDVMRQMAALSPLGTTGRPIDVGMALLYLASDASRFVTGQMLRVSGGA